MMRIAAITASVVLLLDQALKLWVVDVLRLDQLFVIAVWPPYLNLTMAWNRGVNFGLFATDSQVMRWGLIVLALVICIFVWRWAAREGAGWRMQVSTGLLVGGALGNVIDRIRWGAVADFLNVTCCGLSNPYAFNVADIAIFIGAIGLIVFSGRKNEA
jgi:signal peptidase II